MNEGIRSTALHLAEDNIASEPGIEAVYLFPSEDEIRLVEVDRTVDPGGSNERILPYYFGPDRIGGIPYKSAIALIHPDQRKKLDPPSGWGTWEIAERIWPRN